MSFPCLPSGQENFSRLIEGLKQSLLAQVEEYKAFWQTLAFTIDQYCRWLIPLAYTIYLAVLFSNTQSFGAPPTGMAVDVLER